MTATHNAALDSKSAWVTPPGVSFNTIFYQGLYCSQTQIMKYTGPQMVRASTGEAMTCSGRNGLKPINVIYQPFIGKEIQDVNLTSYTYNPLKWIWSCVSACSNWRYGVFVGAVDPVFKKEEGSVKSHRPNFFNISIGQVSDIDSHHTKYKLWKKDFPNNNLILYGASRGAATTFIAYACYKYSEVAMVVLEGCPSSTEDVIDLQSGCCMAHLKRTALSCCTGYHADGYSPVNTVDEIPDNTPFVFIRTKEDKTVPWQSTDKLIQKLFDRRKNPIHVIELKKSGHSTMMYDDAEDRETYEISIHALSKKYGGPYIPELAVAGEKKNVYQNTLFQKPADAPQATINKTATNSSSGNDLKTPLLFGV